MPPEVCPNCGAWLEPNAKACPECGSDEKTGWSDPAQARRLGLPDEDFDYEEFVKEEFAPAPLQPRGVPWFWWLVTVLLIGLFLLLFLH